MQQVNLAGMQDEALAFHQAGRLSEAVRLYNAILDMDPEHFAARHYLGVARHQQGRHSEALVLLAQAVTLDPQSEDAHMHLGVVLQTTGRSEEALAHFDTALAIQPAFASALNNRGAALNSLARQEEALASYDAALAIRPDYVDAHYNRGICLWELKRFAEALASYDAVLAIDPHHAGALCNRGVVLQDQQRFSEAFSAYEETLTLCPDDRYALAGMAVCAQRACDWKRVSDIAGRLDLDIAAGKAVVSLLNFLGMSDNPTLQRACAETYVRNTIARPTQILPPVPIRRHRRIRVAYLSADFHQHATAHLTAELFELHDRDRFEILGISFGVDDGSAMRHRLIRAFDQFHDVRAKSNAEVSKLLRALEVDIAIDLKGHTRDARPGIFAHRPAPVQVSYLGYPGTTGADFIDYVIADPIVLPLDLRPFYAEHIVHLPDCYQPNDTTRAIAEIPERRHLGLPPTGFVFCCFNNNWKITAPIFGIWMRLLRAVPDSVLWLLKDNESARINLCRQASADGIDPARLVFAPRAAQPEHLARHRCADLFLDTLPYNAHTTASDALWVGLPLVTCLGKTFAARVGASLLHAIGLAELVVTDLASYETLALELAQNPQRLQRLRRRLEQNRAIYPLFDTQRFRRHLEAAYICMWEIWQNGEAPKHFRVDPLD